MKLEDVFEEYRKDVSSIKDDLTEIKIWLAKNTDSLDYHIRRTNILEEKVEVAYDFVKITKFLGKFAAGIAGFIGLIYYIVEIFSKVK